MVTPSKRPARSDSAGPERPDEERTLAFLANLAAEFTAVLSLPELVDRVLASLSEEVGFNSCAVALPDPHNPDALTVFGATGVRAAFKGSVIPRGQGIHWAVMESGVPENIPDLHADPRLFLPFENVRSGLYTPLMVHGRPIGILSAYRAQAHGFDKADLDLLTVVARYLAGAFEVARLHEELRELAVTDTLTGLANRRSFLERLAAELERGRRSEQSFVVALVDLDGFKAINDTYGHAAGDATLVRVADALKRGVRGYDMVARFGGDEFILLFPEATPAQAETIIRRFRTIETPPAHGAPTGRLTLCWGLAAFPGDGETADILVNIADTRLYAMKRSAQAEDAHAGEAAGPGPQ